MKVRIRDNSESTLVGEMTAIPSGEMGLVMEMVTDPAKLEEFIPVSGIGDRAAAIALAVKDESPEFSVVRVEEGWSKSGRLWPAREIERIVKQTNELEPVGHLGHIPDDEVATAMPDVQTTWLGAVTKKEPSQQKDRVGEMVTVAYFGGYNLPGAKIRTLLKTKAVRGISWYGHARQKAIPGRGFEQVDFDLQHIDWARKGVEGMPTSRVVAITSEMEDAKMDKELSQVTPAEFKEANPNGYALLVGEAQADMKEQVSEMEGKLTKAQEAEELLGEVTKALKVDDPSKALDAISTLMTKLGDKAKGMVEKLVTEILGEKVKDNKTRQYVKGLLVPVVGEMETKVEDAADEDAAKVIVSEMIDGQFKDNDLIKELVSEQAPPIVRRREELHGANGLKDNPYVEERSRVQV